MFTLTSCSVYCALFVPVIIEFVQVVVAGPAAATVAGDIICVPFVGTAGAFPVSLALIIIGIEPIR